MTYETITISLPETYMQRLRRIAQQELRKPKDQAAYILRNSLLQTTSLNANTHSASTDQSLRDAGVSA